MFFANKSQGIKVYGTRLRFIKKCFRQSEKAFGQGVFVTLLFKRLL